MSLLTNFGGSGFVDFVQQGDRVNWADGMIDLQTSNLSTVPTNSVPLMVPPLQRIIAFGRIQSGGQSGVILGSGFFSPSVNYLTPSGLALSLVAES